MVTKKRAPATRSSTNRKASTSRAGTTRRRRTTRTYTRRRRAGLPTTLGAALGTLVVATLLEASWPVRIALVVGVAVLGVGYVIWRNRAEISAAAAAPATPELEDPAPPRGDSTAAEGDPSHD